MRQLINKKDFYTHIRGRWIVQIAKEKDMNMDLCEVSNSGFWLEKRIRLVTTIATSWIVEPDGSESELVVLAGIYYTNKPISIENFVYAFNGFDSESCYRLLSPKEIEWLAQQMILHNR